MPYQAAFLYALSMYIAYAQIAGTVVYDASRRPVGHLHRVWINPDNGRLLALELLERAGRRRAFIAPQDILDWEATHLRLGLHYELCQREDLVRLDQLLSTNHPNLLKKKVRTESGLALGRVIDFTIHSGSMTLASITTQQGWWLWRGSTRLIHYNQIVVIRPTEIIVKDSLLKVPINQKIPDKFAVSSAPTFDQA